MCKNTQEEKGSKRMGKRIWEFGKISKKPHTQKNEKWRKSAQRNFSDPCQFRIGVPALRTSKPSVCRTQSSSGWGPLSWKATEAPPHRGWELAYGTGGNISVESVWWQPQGGWRRARQQRALRLEKRQTVNGGEAVKRRYIKLCPCGIIDTGLCSNGRWSGRGNITTLSNVFLISFILPGNSYLLFSPWNQKVKILVSRFITDETSWKTQR